MSFVLRTFLVLSLVWVPFKARASENLGELSLSGLLIEPAFTLDEPKRGHFDIARSFIAATWKRDEFISAEMKLGSKSLIGQPARYGPAPTDELGVIEAYGQLDSMYGTLRAGIVPIRFGLEGGDAEEHLRFPRSSIYTNRVINLRDHGIAYHTDFSGFFVDWAIHNGEGGPDLDNEIWFTGRWGWESPHKTLTFGFSGSTGSTNPASTNPLGTSSSTTAGLDVDQRAKIRVANGFVRWRFQPFLLEGEVTGGDTEQDSGIRKLRAGHVDFEFRSSEHLSWLARFDSFDPSGAPNDRNDEYTAGWAWRSKYENSVLYLLGSKVVQENNSQSTHKLQVLWRITPSASEPGRL